MLQIIVYKIKIVNTGHIIFFNCSRQSFWTSLNICAQSDHLWRLASTQDLRQLCHCL